MIHSYLGQTIRYEVVYRKRTSIGITMDFYGNIEVQAPKGTADEKIIEVLEQHWGVIQEKLLETKQRMTGPREFSFENGEKFLYLGKEYPIRIRQDESIAQDFAEFKEEQLVISVREAKDDKIRQTLKRFYYQQCKALVEERISVHQRHFKTKPRSVKISDSKTTWGTCDSNHQLTFNWRLAMAPREVVEYVVIHEMCHMVHLNHDRSFWRLVGKMMPNYKEMENWLALSSWKMTL